MRVKGIFVGASVMIGTIVGAGIFGIPYAFSKTGFALGSIALSLSCLLLGITSLMLADMGKEEDEIPDIYSRYTGKFGFIISSLSLFFLCFGAIVAYNIGIGEAVNALIGIDKRVASIMFVFLISLLGYKGIRVLSEVQTCLVIILITSAFLIAFFLTPGVKISNLYGSSPANFFYTFNVCVFASAGYSSIPILLKFLDKRRVGISVLLAYLFVFVLYFVFALAFLGNYGENIKQIAIENLTGIKKVFGLALVLLCMSTSYISLGYVLFCMLERDFKLNRFLSLFIAYYLPFFVAYIGKLGFVDILSITGAVGMVVTGGLTGIAYYNYSKKIRGKVIGITLTLVYLSILAGTILTSFAS